MNRWIRMCDLKKTEQKPSSRQRWALSWVTRGQASLQGVSSWPFPSAWGQCFQGCLMMAGGPKGLPHVHQMVGRGRKCAVHRGPDNFIDVNCDFLRAVIQQPLSVTFISGASAFSAPVKELSQRWPTSQFLRYNYFFIMRFKEAQGNRTSRIHISHSQPFSPACIC